MFENRTPLKITRYAVLVTLCTTYVICACMTDDCRDIGSSLKSLTVLWMNNCGLEDLDGISSLSQLQVSTYVHIICSMCAGILNVCVFIMYWVMYKSPIYCCVLFFPYQEICCACLFVACILIFRNLRTEVIFIIIQTHAVT